MLVFTYVVMAGRKAGECYTRAADAEVCAASCFVSHVATDLTLTNTPAANGEHAHSSNFFRRRCRGVLSGRPSRYAPLHAPLRRSPHLRKLKLPLPANADAVRFYESAISLYAKVGRFSSAARVQRQIAEIHEEDEAWEAAAEAYQLAADFYSGEVWHRCTPQFEFGRAHCFSVAMLGSTCSRKQSRALASRGCTWPRLGGEYRA